MLCRDAMTSEIITISPEETVADALDLFHVHCIRSVPVVDENNMIVGVFSFSNLLKRLLPVSVTMSDEMTHGHHMDISLEHFTGCAPWVAKRLQAHLSDKIKDTMNNDPRTVQSDTPLEEGIRLLVEYGSPLAVIEKDANEVVGIISSQNIVAALQGMAVCTGSEQEVNE